jgi:light-regulated signal transduction histidine kinase (bacteriophytochrome)
MQTASKKEAKYEIEELQAALQAETQLRLEAEDNLRRAHQDFEEFLLTAAHDLREPLRTVNAYSELLARKDAARTDAETDQFRRYIQAGTGKIQSLVAGVVEYAAAASDDRYILPADMNEVFREAAVYGCKTGSTTTGSLKTEKTAVVTRDPMPVVRGDFAKLVKVAGHLLDNASRYSDAAEPRTHVSSRRDGSEWVFIVRDNGPGIDAVYHERIFEPFKRLHGRQFAGCGLGLSFCRKVIESHGGRIWVDSKPGEGSTFCFTLPAGE